MRILSHFRFGTNSDHFVLWRCEFYPIFHLAQFPIFLCLKMRILSHFRFGTNSGHFVLWRCKFYPIFHLAQFPIFLCLMMRIFSHFRFGTIPDHFVLWRCEFYPIFDLAQISGPSRVPGLGRCLSVVTDAHTCGLGTEKCFVDSAVVLTLCNAGFPKLRSMEG